MVVAPSIIGQWSTMLATRTCRFEAANEAATELLQAIDRDRRVVIIGIEVKR